jgi:hypothetical protein
VIDNISLVQKYIAANNAFELNQCECIYIVKYKYTEQSGGVFVYYLSKNSILILYLTKNVILT